MAMPCCSLGVTRLSTAGAVCCESTPTRVLSPMLPMSRFSSSSLLRMCVASLSAISSSCVSCTFLARDAIVRTACCFTSVPVSSRCFRMMATTRLSISPSSLMVSRSRSAARSCIAIYRSSLSLAFSFSTRFEKDMAGFRRLRAAQHPPPPAPALALPPGAPAQASAGPEVPPSARRNKGLFPAAGERASRARNVQPPASCEPDRASSRLR
mmetsp:Transcript_27201/g.67086  ORF Transcript_27201/g.67086 Transcript_27201/m.67086 type:complete len:211 (-) Transcript_27201:44-676(-)